MAKKSDTIVKEKVEDTLTEADKLKNDIKDLVAGGSAIKSVVDPKDAMAGVSAHTITFHISVQLLPAFHRDPPPRTHGYGCVHRPPPTANAMQRTWQDDIDHDPADPFDLAWLLSSSDASDPTSETSTM